MAKAKTPVLELKSVSRHYDEVGSRLEVLKDASLTIQTGEMVALVAPSGAGKSTLLHTAGLLEKPNGGEVLLSGQACSGLTDRQRTARRRNDVGYVYQFHHLLPEFSALENVMMPQMIRGLSKEQARKH
ncbi:MAG: ATP-binding cassette domain-containing protein, partial [Pseudomonadota bacterium]